MSRHLTAIVALSALVLVATPGAQQRATSEPNRWEPAMQKFEEQEKTAPSPKGEIVFWGASSIVRWNLPEYFPNMKVINRGFGGSEMADAARYAPRIVVPLRPRIVVLYPGENDIARGVTAETVSSGFQQFFKNIHDPLPQTRIIAIGLKPTPVRWQFVDEGRKANQLIKAFCGKQSVCTYVNVEPEMLGKDGHPRPELYVSDGEHMTPEGYKIWTRLVTPLLQ
jgi:lysophospholipase L1-like esterase